LSKVLVGIYTDELTDSNNNKFIYADTLWIITNLGIQDIKGLFDTVSLDLSPSDIGDYKTVEALINDIRFINNRYAVTGFLEEFGKENIKRIKVLYWD